MMSGTSAMFQRVSMFFKRAKASSSRRTSMAVEPTGQSRKRAKSTTAFSSTEPITPPIIQNNNVAGGARRQSASISRPPRLTASFNPAAEAQAKAEIGQQRREIQQARRASRRVSYHDLETTTRRRSSIFGSSEPRPRVAFRKPTSF